MERYFERIDKDSIYNAIKEGRKVFDGVNRVDEDKHSCASFNFRDNEIVAWYFQERFGEGEIIHIFFNSLKDMHDFIKANYEITED